MSRLKNIQNYYFIGIGGIGMSALAKYFHADAQKVYGYDKTPSDITRQLQNSGVSVVFEDSPISIPNHIHKNNTIVVYTPAIPKDNILLNTFQKAGFTIVKRAQLLGWITQKTRCLAVAGTHGKTTTSSILAHLLVSTGEPVCAFLGGIVEGYNSNFIQQGNQITVVEADEFDRSFLQLNPYIAGITSMDADHLDIYGNDLNIKKAFNEFADLIANKKRLLHKKGLPLGGMTVAVEESADFETRNVRIINGYYHFDFKTPNTLIKELVFKLPGRHNLFNASLALGMAITSGSPPESLPEALFNFQGVQRRFSYKLKTDRLVLIDDYAHHPQEITAVYQALNEMYPARKKVVIFQPHLYSRTRDFGDAFAKSLNAFNEILLLDIYPAREKAIPGISSEWLLEKIKNKRKKLISKAQIATEIKNSEAEVVAMMGAGDIGDEVKQVVKKLTQ